MSRRPDIAIDKSQLIQLLTWFFFVISFFGICARVGTKYVMSRWSLRWDDTIVLLAEVIFLGQSISVSLGASHGLGKAVNTLSDDTISSALKAEYASVPLLILTLTLVKCSLSAFIHHLSPDPVHRRINTGIIATVGLWAVTATTASLFQCSIPAPWDYLHRRCIDRRTLWTYTGALNIATELGFITLYYVVLWRLQIPLLKRAILLSIFSTRILVVAAIAFQIAVFRNAYEMSDITFRAWLPIISNQIVGSLSITTACIPYLKPFMQSLEADIMRVDSVGDSREEESRDFATSGSTGYILSRYGDSLTNCSSSAR